MLQTISIAAHYKVKKDALARPTQSPTMTQ